MKSEYFVLVKSFNWLNISTFLMYGHFQSLSPTGQWSLKAAVDYRAKVNIVHTHAAVNNVHTYVRGMWIVEEK